MLAHTKLESTVQYLSIEANDAFEICASLKYAAELVDAGRIYPDNGHCPC